MINIDISEEKRNDPLKKEDIRNGELREVNSNPLMKQSDISDNGGEKEKEKRNSVSWNTLCGTYMNRGSGLQGPSIMFLIHNTTIS